ncbi:hypothetical protein RIF23_16150 [Lipingzhangella sp. LS1_29]|uniref:WXG100 family type VII secretion target n=1 Tax=Lipingzhangella rawalii TaxID=2055835 RepID=A0ABU2H944_9ACTN|nr:hypothetical protein [Lipingzhangella rawalii]MDS1271826.1 hypothetical protein [Lipingzhangella rawalii]
MTGHQESAQARGLGLAETHRLHRAIQALDQAAGDLARVSASGAARELWDAGGLSWLGSLLEPGAAHADQLAEQLRAAASGTGIVLPTQAQPMGGGGDHV